MTTPVHVACDKLREDASLWTAVAGEVRTAGRSAAGLALGPDKLGHAAAERGIVAAYQAVQQRIAQLLTGGATEFENLATTLRKVADTYQREDDQGAHNVAQAGGN